jgi:serine/threonine-protein kinase RsbW
MSPEARHKLTLMVEELFTNTVRHGYRGDSEGLVELSLAQDGNKLLVTYADTAPRYDSLAAAMQTDIEATIRQQRIGGLGLALTFAMAETAQYAYLDGKNRIVLLLKPAP